MANVTVLRQDLERRLDVLLERVDRIAGDLRKLGDPDWQERATELENDDVLEGLDEASRAEAAAIRAALSRIDAGTYGRCARCGHGIGAARLAALPSATTCVACARG
jgi:RNA polymerase-binding transcription factor DksA